MKDILNRDVKEGDIIIVKPTGRDSHGLHLAVWHEGQVLLCRWREVYKTSYGQCFIVENPTKEERAIADNLIEMYYKQKADREEEKKREKDSALKRKDLKVWDQTDRGYFLGEVEIDGERYKNAFLNFYSYSDGTYSIAISEYSKDPYWDALKSFPRVQRADRKFDLSKEEIKEAIREKRAEMAKGSYYRRGLALKPLTIIETGEIL
ncbi:MAG: hypothetical protein ACRDDH_11860 [Cetobacterium sp.]|uniref:hypothetical protein n=1 Tax=Cetobacterium sp. TaxID=2071632 RepID=UPI003EE76200